VNDSGGVDGENTHTPSADFRLAAAEITSPTKAGTTGTGVVLKGIYIASWGAKMRRGIPPILWLGGTGTEGARKSLRLHIIAAQCKTTPLCTTA
jgi:hypothetical protein